MAEKKTSSFVWASMIVAIAIIVLGRILPTPDGLTRAGLSSISLILAGIFLWCSNAMPMGITAVCLAALMPFLGILNAAGMYSSFAGSVFFFMLATFAFTAALSQSTIPYRVTGLVLKLAGNDSKKIFIGFMLGTMALSSVMSNIPTCALFISIAYPLIKANDAGAREKKDSRLGKCFMIGLANAAALGGFITPAGGPINLLAIQFVEQYAGMTIRFLDWVIVGLPISVISTIILSLCYIKCFKPEPVSAEAIDTVKKKIDEMGSLTVKDKKIICIMLVTIALWISSTWFPVLNTTLIALLSLCTFFIPGVEVLDWSTYSKNVNINILFMLGGVSAVATGIVATGAANWLVNAFMGGVTSWPPLLVVFMVSVLACLLHNIIPAGPAVASLACPPIIGIALSCGISPAACCAIIAWWASTAFFLPFDAITLVTYGEGYYSMKDMFKSGIIPTCIFLVFLVVLQPFYAMLGY